MPEQINARDFKIHHLLLFVPEGNKRPNIPIELEDKWVKKILKLCANLFGGATAYGRGIGVWKSNVNNKKIYWDRVTVIESWISAQGIQNEFKFAHKIITLTTHMAIMGSDLGEEAVMFLLDGEQFIVQKEKLTYMRKGEKFVVKFNKSKVKKKGR